MKSFVLAAAVLAAAACAPAPQGGATAPSPPDAPEAAPPVGPIPLRRFDERTSGLFRYQSGVDQAGRQVVRDAAAWSALWARITAPYGERPPVPAVDFEREMVLVAAMGSRATGGYSVSIEGVDGRGGEWVARVTERRPGPRCGTTQAVTAPVDVAVVPRSDASVRWEVREVATDCS